MHTRLTRKSIRQKTIEVGLSTLVSRILGLVREVLQVRYFGAGAVADAFLTAFRIPNSLRKIFAEGALSAAYIPTLVHVVKHEGLMAAGKLTTLIFFIVQSLIMVICFAVFKNAERVVYFLAPGWFAAAGSSTDAVLPAWLTFFGTIECGAEPSPERVVLAIALVKILIFFIAFISATSVLTGALQARNHFRIPAMSQIIANIMFATELILALTYNLPASFIAWCMLFNGAVLLIVHAITYARYEPQFHVPDRKSFVHAWTVLKKFLPCLITIGAVEINLFIDQVLASYLPEGSVSLIYYTSCFVRIPLGVFAVAFSTVLLPHFSRVHTYAPKRLGFYLFEATKLVFWLTLPATLAMIFFSHDIFYTTMLSKNFTANDVAIAAQLLSAFSLGLFFFSLNKIVLNIFYAFGSTVVPTIITLIATICNTILNLILMCHYGAWGIVVATSMAAALQTVLFIVVLSKKFHVKLYGARFISFAARATVQLIAISLATMAAYYVGEFFILKVPAPLCHFLLKSFGFWLWVGPLLMVSAWLLYATRRRCGLHMHFLE